VWVDIARLRFRRGDHAGALEAAQEALGHGPRFAPALVLRGQMARDAFGLGAALVWFEAALEADPDNTLALTEYAATLGDAGYHGQMLAAVRRLTKVEEKSPDAMYLQAVLAARAQMPVLAKNLLERSGKAENEVPAALMLDALVDLLENNHDSAAESRLARLPERPRHLFAFFDRGAALERLRWRCPAACQRSGRQRSNQRAFRHAGRTA
jgi:tetratricopeptide (TPR) repeat protein